MVPAAAAFRYDGHTCRAVDATLCGTGPLLLAKSQLRFDGTQQFASSARRQCGSVEFTYADSGQKLGGLFYGILHFCAHIGDAQRFGECCNVFRCFRSCHFQASLSSAHVETYLQFVFFHTLMFGPGCDGLSGPKQQLCELGRKNCWA